MFESRFDIGARVWIDADRTLIGVVSGFLWRVEKPQVEVCWFHSGTHHSEWIAEWRLTLVRGE